MRGGDDGNVTVIHIITKTRRDVFQFFAAHIRVVPTSYVPFIYINLAIVNNFI